MSELALTFLFFLFVMASVGAVLLLLRWRIASQPVSDAPGADGWGPFLRSMLFIGEIAPAPKRRDRTVREQLIAAGYRSPLAVSLFHGIKSAAAIALAIVAGWAALLVREDPFTALLAAVCAGGFGFLLPERVLDYRIRERAGSIDASLAPAIDLMLLSVEAGQALDSALVETSRELRDLYPEISSELQQVQLELRAGRSRAEVLYELGRRTDSAELKKLALMLVDADRFGSSLGPTLRAHARYIRTRRKLAAQETARKLGVKLIFPVFFLVMPSVFLVTLGPALIQIFETLKPMMEGN
ncbi:MAG: type II secretion system F family protein [Bryobacteraceae bacterium]|nr:type II secretion system F family protein [Bryobacteraceae bacterium]